MGKTILVVDDSASMRQLVTFALKSAGYDVIAAVHGKDGLEKLKACKVDMIVTDLNMPEMDGIELIKNVRSNPAFEVHADSYADHRVSGDAETGRKDGGSERRLVKPFKPEELVGIVKKFIK